MDTEAAPISPGEFLTALKKLGRSGDELEACLELTEFVFPRELGWVGLLALGRGLVKLWHEAEPPDPGAGALPDLREGLEPDERALFDELLEPPEEGIELAGDEGLRYYQACARHNRRARTPHLPRHPRERVRTDFRGAIWVVRVPLRQSRPPRYHVTRTAIGEVSGDDHSHVYSIDEFNGFRRRIFGEGIPCAARVDLITGGRRLTRFTPVSLYLAYAADTDEVPMCWAMQSSYFDGRPGRFYVAETLDSRAVTQAGFRPTPFADPKHLYALHLELCEGTDEPARLVGELFAHGPEGVEGWPNYRKYMDVEMSYELTEPGFNLPLIAQAEAFCRVCAIEDWSAHVRRKPGGRLGEQLHRVAAWVGRRLPWDQKPEI